MKKKHPHKTVAFEKENEEKTVFLEKEHRILTAAGYRRRTEQGCQSTRSRSLYRGRRQGKG
jgi:hypothetical protein